MRGDAHKGHRRADETMTQHRRATFFLIVGAALVSLPSLVEAGPRAVVELFTSQGCSSCPLADKLLGELSDDPSLVTMSLPIDYWDYLGWKDTLAKPRHTARQRAYSVVRGDRQVYTPQVVVNGSVQVLGSDKAGIERAIGRSAETAGTLSVPVTLTISSGRLIVTAAAATEGAEAGAQVWLCALSKAVPVAIDRGENRGKTIIYHNVVRRWLKLGDWAGGAQTWSVPVEDVKKDDIDTVVALVQSGTADKPGVMLGAEKTSLR
jgi:hypothetical protein